jgi:hypothetical protein
MIDRCRRNDKVDIATLTTIRDVIKSTIVGQALLEEKAHKQAIEVYYEQNPKPPQDIKVRYIHFQPK